MKLVHIVPSLEEQHGGPSKSVRALCAALAAEGHHVDLLTTHPSATPPDDLNATENERFNLQAFRRDWPQRLCPSAGLRRALDNTSPEVVHHHALWLRTVHYARQRARRTRVPFVVSPRGMMSAWAWRHHRWRKRVSRFLIHPGAFAAVDGWHATSAEEAAEIRALGFRQPVCVAPNGVERPGASEIAHARAFWHSRCPAAATRPTALFYSRFHRKKRVLELIDVWLERAPRDWLLLLVGLPEDYSPEQLEQHASQRGSADRVAAFSGAGCPAPYAVASLFLLPSHSENFGLAIAEAMAHGVPALVTDTTPWRTLNPALGWCVPWSDYGAALAAATAEPDSARRARGAAAREWVLREFAWQRSARALGEFYTTLRQNLR